MTGPGAYGHSAPGSHAEQGQRQTLTVVLCFVAVVQ